MKNNDVNRGPGRPETFDREEVVGRAVGAFWQSGFDGTSLAKLTDATGVERSTLYNSFGGKAGLYASAAAVYVDTVEVELFAPLNEGTGENLGDVIEFLDRLDASIGSTDFPAGCFIVNDLRSPERDQIATERYLIGLTDGLRSSLDRAGLGQPVLEQRTKAIAAAVIGINAIAQHDQEAALQMLTGLRDTVRQWQKPN